MLSRIFVVLSCLAIFVMPIGVSFAQGEEVAADAAAEAREKAHALAKAQADALQGRINSVAKGLDQAQLTHFLVMYTNYSIFSMVKAVRSDVGNAVEGCKSNNPEMADDLNNKFSNWEKSVGESMEDVEANIKTMAVAQDYVSQNDLNTIYALVDEARAVNSSQFEKTPVTTPEACEFMMSKMDETQESMIKLLSGTLQSYPNMVKKNQK